MKIHKSKTIRSKRNANKRRGFSLIELIIIIAILAVCTAVLAPSLLSNTERSRAQRDVSAMDEVVNAVHLAMTDPYVYDELMDASLEQNVSCYIDTAYESDHKPIQTKPAIHGSYAAYTFGDDARMLDETKYYAAGNMYGVTITFESPLGSNKTKYVVADAVVNKFLSDGTTKLTSLPRLYNAIRQVVGDTVEMSSQTYRNSDYTVFVTTGITGGNDLSDLDFSKAYGQYSGTNLPMEKQEYWVAFGRVVEEPELGTDPYYGTNGGCPIKLSKPYGVAMPINTAVSAMITFEFNKDGTYATFAEGYQYGNGTWEYENGVLIMDGNESDPYTVSADGKTMMIDGMPATLESDRLPIFGEEYSCIIDGSIATVILYADGSFKYSLDGSEFENAPAGSMTYKNGRLFVTNDPSISGRISDDRRSFSAIWLNDSGSYIPKFELHGGLRFGEPYSIDNNGDIQSIIFYKNGSVALYENGAFVGRLPAGSCTYSKNTINVDGSPIAIISPGGSSIVFGDELVLSVSSGVKYGEPYTGTIDGDSVTFICYPNGYVGLNMGGEYIYTDADIYAFGDYMIVDGALAFVVSNGGEIITSIDGKIKFTLNRTLRYGESYVYADESWPLALYVYHDGSVDAGLNGEFIEIAQSGTLTHAGDSLRLVDTSEIVATISPDGTKINLIGGELAGEYILVEGNTCEHKYTNSHICVVCGYENKYNFTADGYKQLTGIDVSVGNVVIPEVFKDINGNIYKVTSIGEDAFYYCTSLTSVTIPDSVTSIGYYAFYGCSGLTSITIPNSVTSIGHGAFEYCSGLTSITIPDSVTSIGYGAFKNCSGLTSVIIPDSVTSIGNSAFEYCTGLTSITIPDSVTSIDARAFYGCSGLTSVTLGNSVTSIGNWAFRNCTGLTSIQVDANNTVYRSENNCLIETASNTLILGCKNSVIPNSVTSIGSYAFYECSGLTSITIPDSVTSIGSGAFEGCSGLTSIAIPNKVTSIGSYAFYGCRGLTSIAIPNKVTSIGSYAFYGCRGLTGNLIIPDSVTSIGDWAFDGCSGLTSITIPDSVTSIGSYVFYGCSGLTGVTIPNSVTSIGSGAFKRCSSLTSITIPDSVTSIGEDAFWGCSGLTSIQVDVNNSVYYSKNNCIITTSSNTLILGCKNSIIPDSVTSIGEDAFYECSGLTSITIPDSVTSIGSGAFEGCSGLTSITIPDSVTSIGRYAFDNCSKLTSVIFENQNGWWYASSSTATSGTKISATDLADPDTAATYLKSTYRYYYWFRTVT